MNHHNLCLPGNFKVTLCFLLVGSQGTNSRAEVWTLERILKHPSWSHLRQLGKLGPPKPGVGISQHNGGEYSCRVSFLVEVQQEAIPHILGGDNVARSSAFGLDFWNFFTRFAWRILFLKRTFLKEALFDTLRNFEVLINEWIPGDSKWPFFL